MSRRRALIAAALAATGGLLLLEGLLHLLPVPRYASNWVYDPLLGHRGPRSELQQQFIGVGTTYNAFGFRGEDPTPRAVKPDQHSVFVFGDSITEAVQLPWRRSYAKRLEYLLNEALGRDTEVTSWAISDYGTANELLLYATEAKWLKPDVVVLQFLGLNDFVNNGLAFAGHNKSRSDFARPYLIPSRARGSVPELEPIPGNLRFTYLSPGWKWWREHVRLLSYFDLLRTQRRWAGQAALGEAAPESDACDTEAQVFLDDPGPDWQDAFEATQQLAAAFQTQVQSTESSTPGKPPRLVAFYAPSYFEVFDPSWQRGVELGLLRCSQKSYHRENPERRFLELFRKAGVEAYSLREDFLHAPVPVQQLYLSDGHFSAEGHAVVARALSRLIAQPARALTRQR